MTTTFTPTATPPSLTALFTMRSDFCADLSLTTRGAFGTIITVLHEGLHDVAVHILIGDDSLALSVQDGESLTIMARCEGTIIGCGVFEVDTSTVQVLGTLLIPRALSNLIVNQCKTETLAAGIEAALERCKERYNTDALPDPTEMAVAQ